MNRVLVLGARDTATAWSRRLRQLPRNSNGGRRTSKGKGESYEAVLVVNDRSPAAVAHLSRALQLKQRRPELAIAVLSVVEPSAIDPDAALDNSGLSLAEADRVLEFDRLQAAATMVAEHPELSVSVRAGVLTFEYSG